MAAIFTASLPLVPRSTGGVSAVIRCRATSLRQSASVEAAVVDVVNCPADSLAVTAAIGSSRIQLASSGDGASPVDYDDHYYYYAQEEESSRTETSMAAEEEEEDEEELRSTWEHRVWVAVGCVAIGGVMARGFAKGGEAGTAAAAVVAAYVAADFLTGVYHWGVDNYGSSRTPILGGQIEAFQGHHERPWTIARREVANNLHALARGAAAAMAAVWVVGGGAVAEADEFAAAVAGWVVLSQQIHAWAHSRKSEIPPMVLALQKARILLPRTEHGAHHRPPFEGKYCIVSGHWNGILDGMGFFRALERFIFATYGVAPRSWANQVPPSTYLSE